ncbi:hypothetical protein J3F83DRAFT_739293 [Trichoderma novae-zelandiae]
MYGVQAQGRVAFEGIVAFPYATSTASGTGFAARQSSYRTPCVCPGSASRRLCPVPPPVLLFSSLLFPPRRPSSRRGARQPHAAGRKQTNKQTRVALLCGPRTEHQGGVRLREAAPPLPWLCWLHLLFSFFWWTGILVDVGEKKRCRGEGGEGGGKNSSEASYLYYLSTYICQGVHVSHEGKKEREKKRAKTKRKQEAKKCRLNHNHENSVGMQYHVVVGDEICSESTCPYLRGST